jgi:ribosomal protein S18 acetylase RimI-like enzyme
MLLDELRNLLADEDFAGLETNVQKVNVTAARLYQKIGFTLENNPRNNASWIARAGKEVLTKSPVVTLLDRWRGRKD